MAEPIRVVLADDHPLVRAGIRTILKIEPDLLVIGEAADGYGAQRLCQDLQPDVLLLDLHMPGPAPSATVAYLREHCPALKVIVLSAYGDDAYVRRIAAVGVMGYVLKDEAPQVVIHAIRVVVQGGTWLSRPILEKLVHWGTGKLAHGEEPMLTERERDMLCMMARGWDNPRIADALKLAPQTLRNYLSRLYAKLEVSSQREAIAYARDHGLVDN